jgi:hypothetical protein
MIVIVLRLPDAMPVMEFFEELDALTLREPPYILMVRPATLRFTFTDPVDAVLFKLRFGDYLA